MGSDAANAASPVSGPSARPSVLPGQLSEEQAAVYDRQLRVWWVEAQKRLGASRFFVAGLTGLAAEACKNVVLAGIGTMLLYEDGVPVGEAAPGNFLAAAGAAEDATTRCVPPSQSPSPPNEGPRRVATTRRRRSGHPFRRRRRDAVSNVNGALD